MTICAGVCFGALAHRYAAYKIALGPEPEEEDEKAMQAAYAARRFSWQKFLSYGESRRRAERYFFAVCSAGIWGIFLKIFGLDWTFPLYALTVSILMALSLVDTEIQELPPELNLLTGILGALHLMTDIGNWAEYLIGAVLVSGMLFLIGLLRFRGQEAMGGGDVKLMAALGLLLGWKKILLVLVIGCILGTAIHLTLMLFAKKSNRLAFGPYLAMGALVTMCFGQQIIDWYIGFLTAAIR
ncbi:MAG: prepilin peptidase [Lachnospiraceae bacterium]|nr:prepilin peptidase [Lachnospiraceae bacterium]